VEEEVRKGNLDLQALGFWSLVTAAKKDQKVAHRYAGRLGEVDRLAFVKAVRVFPLRLGLISLLILSVAGVYLATLGGLLTVISAFVLYFSVHPLAHYAAGKAGGIDFTCLFFDGPLRIEPNIKIDYSTYLLASVRARVAMHLSGITSSLLAVLFVLIYAYVSGISGFTLLLMEVWFGSIFLSELVILVANAKGKRRILGINFGKTDTGRAFREYAISADS
jgi:hypothetical protein